MNNVAVFPRTLRVIAFGNDRDLLKTRELLLKHVNLKAVSYTDLAALEEAEANSPVDLVILCHTLSAAQQELATTMARLHWPDSRVLILSCGGSKDRFAGGLVFNVSRGPEAFLCHVKAVFN